MTVRDLDEATLDMAARDYAAHFLQPTRYDRTYKDRVSGGRGWVIKSLHDGLLMDEFAYLVHAIKTNGILGKTALGEFEEATASVFSPRLEEVFDALLAEHYAVTRDGKPIPGKVGKVGTGRIVVGRQLSKRGNIRPVKCEVYVGETVEEAIERFVKEHPEDGTWWRTDPNIKGGVGATNTRISNECALLGANAIVDNLDEGAGAAVVQGRTGAQPADPDTVTSGTNLFTWVCSATAFGAATDAAPGGLKTANAVTSDTSADATGTLGYCRASSTADGATPADDHIDGEAGTSGADFNLNTLAIVIGATVALSAWTVTQPES